MLGMRDAATRGGALAALIIGLTAPNPCAAEVRLPKVFASHMVLQRQIPLPVWGWASPGETVTVQVAGESAKAQANAKGEWKATLPALKAGGPHTMTVSGSSVIKLEDVLVGEVWLCSGQSNMEQGIGMCNNPQQEIAAASHPQIRLLLVPNRFTPRPMADMEGAWKACTPKTIAEDGWGGFSGVAYFFGRELQRTLSVPVGLIDATWGGTVIQTWTPPEGFAAVPALKGDHDRVLLADPSSAAHKQQLSKVLSDTEAWLAGTRKAMAASDAAPAMPTFPAELLPPSNVQHATALYNGMINPVRPFGIRGAIWYQGESNLGEGKTYTERMKALIGGWRKVWGQGDFPFYFVQVAPYNYGNNPATEPEFWEAQTAAQAISNTGMAVINDIGELADIHPKNKQDVGKRLAFWALAKTYGKSEVVYLGPTFKTMAAEGAKLRITFDNAAGLKSRDGKPISWFEIIDKEEGGFVKADAAIDGSSVVLSSPEVRNPVAVRYAWHMLAEPNLSNGAGLPANSFRAGDVPKRDLLAINVPEAKQYKLLYDLDLGKVGADVRYDVDNRKSIQGPVARVAYFLELTGQDGFAQYLYVSMDAFSQDLGKLGVPTPASGAKFQQNVTNMNVLSNVKSIVNGAGLKGGNIEFWPHNYGPPNNASVPNASGADWDFGDEPVEPTDGYGSMQVHNHDAKQTLFAINNWKSGSGADLGIGTRAAKELDWTFAANAGSYLTKRLRVLVLPKQ